MTKSLGCVRGDAQGEALARQRRWLAPPCDGRQLLSSNKVRKDGWERVEDTLEEAQNSVAGAETGNL